MCDDRSDINHTVELQTCHCLRMCDTKGSVFDKMLLVDDNDKRVSGTCTFIAFTRAPGIGLKDRMHSSTY